VHDHDNDNNIGHEHQHEHHHKPSYDYGEYGYQFQPECSNAWDSNEHPDEPPVQPLEDYAIPLAPFRQRENYDYALILAKELCTLTRDTSGLTVTSIHEVGCGLPFNVTHRHAPSHTLSFTFSLTLLYPHTTALLYQFTTLSHTFCIQPDHPIVV
jgi:hypothetical protein